LTGEKPFTADYLPTLLFKIVREDPAPPQRLNSTLAASVETVMRRALAKNPADRYETCAEFVNALAAACNASGNWVPLPRGSSHNLPTAGSQEGLSTTLSDTMAENPAAEDLQETVAAPPLSTVPPPAAVPLPSIVPLPVRRAPPSHTGRNIALGLLAAAVAGIAIYFLLPESAPPAPPAAVTAQTIPTTPVPPPVEAAPPDPEPAAAAPAPKAEPVAAVPTPAPAPAGPTDASFALTTQPTGAEAVFDGDAAHPCNTPCTLRLAMGRHTLRIRHAGYRDAQRVFSLPDEPGLIVNLDTATGTLSLVTNPANLTVFIDGQEQARKTPSNFVLPAGEHRVQVIRGGEKQEFTVAIRDGGVSQKNIDWSQ
jgi:hypothetical protein